MTNQLDPGALSEIVIAGFLRHGASEDECQSMRETILIREGVYYGRSFRIQRLLATITAETDCVQFHTSAGEFLESVPAPAVEVSSERHAA